MARLAFDPGELSHATRHGTSADPIGIRLEPSLCQLAAQKFLLKYSPKLFFRFTLFRLSWQRQWLGRVCSAYSQKTWLEVFQLIERLLQSK